MQTLMKDEMCNRERFVNFHMASKPVRQPVEMWAQLGTAAKAEVLVWEIITDLVSVKWECKKFGKAPKSLCYDIGATTVLVEKQRKIKGKDLLESQLFVQINNK